MAANRRKEVDRLVQQEMERQRKVDENKAQRAKMEAIDQRLKEKQAALRQQEAEQAEQRKREQH